MKYTENKGPINILVTLDENYMIRLNIMLVSMIACDIKEQFDVYLLHSGISEEALKKTEGILEGHGKLHPICIKESGLDDAPTTDRYPVEIYYRIFAARYLPENIDKVLYLDPDIIVNKSLRELYNLQMEDSYFAAASHIGTLLHMFNEVRLDMDEESPYINSGVMLINLKQLRKEQKIEDVFNYIKEHKGKLFLPDQDIISALYGDKIMPLDPFIYNMTERLFSAYRKSIGEKIDIEFVRNNSVIIHYCGRNKPWKNVYFGKLNIFYDEALERYNEKFPGEL